MDQESEAADAQTLPVAAQRQGRRRRSGVRRNALTPALVLFTRDLRVDDHAALAAASHAGPVVPALVIDPVRAERLSRSPRRAAFFCGAVDALARDLAARDARLIVRSGPAVTTVRKLAREAGAQTVVWSAGYDPVTSAADRNLQAALEERGLRAIVVHDAPAVPPEETAIGRSGGGAGYLALAPYFDAWDAAPRATFSERVTFAPGDHIGSEALPRPDRFGSAEPAALRASSAAANEALDAFLAGPALAYATAHDLPAQPTSQLSAHLSFGTIAARTVLRRLAERATDPFLLTEEKRSLRAFAHALARRDFFLQLAWSSARKANQPLQRRMRAFPFARTHPAFVAWREGRTGYPLVDAGMRELAATGTMHPRARQIAASFLCFDLGVDWRVGRDAWERMLVEDDPALADGNWQWVAGVGADLAQFPRIFNPDKQARRLDPAGAYIRRWIPELASSPLADVLAPAQHHRAPQLGLPLFGADAYPPPVVEHENAARAFLKRYAAFVRDHRSGF